MSRLAFVILTLNILWTGCSADSAELTKAEGLTQEGIQWLSEGRYRPAKARFWQVIDPVEGASPHNCEATWGYVLADFFEFIGGLLDTGDWDGDNNGNAFGGDSLMPLAVSATPELDGYLSSILLPVADRKLAFLRTYLPDVLVDGCTFYIEGGIPMQTAARTRIYVGERFAATEAHFMMAFGAALEGALNYLGAHDLRVDYAGALRDVADAYAIEDATLMVRSIGGAVSRSTGFLTWHPQRKQRFDVVQPLLLMAINQIRQGLDSLFDHESNDTMSERALGYEDLNQNGKVDRGDALWLGITGADPQLELFDLPLGSYPINLADSDLGPVIGSLLFGLINDRFLERLDQLLVRVSDNIQGRGALLNITEFNRLLPLPLIPEVLAFDFSRIFSANISDTVPLRSFLPAWGHYDAPGDAAYGDYVTFLYETEQADSASYKQEVAANPVTAFCYDCAPGPRFALYTQSSHFSLAPEITAAIGETEVTVIADDCLDPESGDSYGYMYWQDPSFNQSVYINLAGLQDHTCDNDFPYNGTLVGDKPLARSSAKAASRYSFGKLINFYLGAIPLVDELEP